jgi:hypothetical protein
MARTKSKGTVLSITVSSVLTAVPGIIDAKWSGAKSLAVACETLDNSAAGIPYEVTGSSEPGTISGNLYFDPVNTVHLAMLALITTPATVAGSLAYASGTVKTQTFTAASMEMGTEISNAKDPVKSPFSMQLAAMPSAPA